MKTAEDWVKEQFGIWEHPETKNSMGWIDWSAQELVAYTEKVQQDAKLDALKEGMRRAAKIADACDDGQVQYLPYKAILTAAEQLTEKDL